MIKKIILTSAFCLALTTGYGAASSAAGISIPQEQTEIAGDAGVQEVAAESGEVSADAESVSSIETDARKLKQAEKADNLKEKDAYGGALTIMSMCVVLLALIVLSILFMCFGKVSSSFQSRKKKEAHDNNPLTSGETSDAPDSGETIAAIALALDEYFGGKHDIEDTILTIKRMRRAYSPWNSKIYNMRQTPDLKKWK